LAGGTAHPGDTFARGFGRTWLDEVACTGDEPTLSDCPANDWGVEDCVHRDDASVTCTGPIPSECKLLIIFQPVLSYMHVP